MPEFGQNFRTQILVGLKAEGVGEADRIAQEMMRLERAMGFARERFRQTITDSTELRQELAPLKSDFNALAKELERVQAATAAQVAEQARLISSSGAWGTVLRQSGANMAAYARQIEEESGKATQKQIADADKATAAVAKLSNETNTLLDRDAAATEAAEQRKAQARAQAEAQHEAELERGHQAHLAFLAREEAAEVAATAKHDADLQRSHQKHLEFLAREEAAEQAAIDSLQRQKDEALNREANRRRNVEANITEGAAKRETQAQIAALEELGRQAITTGDRFHALRNEWLDLVNAGKGDTPRANAILDQLDHLREGLAKTGYQVQTVTGAFEDNNRVINAGAGYARKHWTELEGLNRVVRNVAGAFYVQGKAAEGSEEGIKKASYGLLHIAHAVQDAQYGFGAVLNNIPLVVQALGGGPGLAGTVMIAGVAFEVLKGHVGDFRTQIGMAIDPMQAFARSSEDLKKKLDLLEQKAFKVDVDYSEIERAKFALQALKEAEAAYDAAKKTKAEGALSEEAKKVVDAAGGAGKVSAAILGDAMARGVSFAKQSDIDESANLQRLIEADRKSMEGKDRLAQAIIQKHVDVLEGQRATIEERIKAANVQFATDMTGRFLLGDEEAVRTVKGLAERQPQAFKPEARRRLKELPETAEEKEWKDMAEESDKWIDEQVKEGKKLEEQQVEARRRADEALIAGHAAAFGAKKALGGLIEAETKKLLAAGEKDPERLRAAARAIAEADIKESKFVQEGLIPAVAAKVAEPHVEAAVAQTIGGAAPGQGIVAAAKAGIAAEEAKAKAKVERPEISHEAARIGREAAEGIHTSILEWAAQNTPVEQIRKGMMGWMTRNVKEAGVKPELAPDVAAKLFEEELGKVRAELLVRGGVNAQTARAELGERQVKAIGQQQGQARRVERVQDVARRPAIAQEIMFRSGGMASPEQAEHGAEHYQSLINQGVPANVAERRVMSELGRMIQQQRVIMDQTNAMMNGMANMLGQANQHLGMVGAQQGMMRGQMNQQRWQKPAPWNTIPGG